MSRREPPVLERMTSCESIRGLTPPRSEIQMQGSRPRAETVRKEKLSPSPGRGGGLTTAIANSRSHGIEPVRADRRRIEGVHARCTVERDDGTARNGFLVSWSVVLSCGIAPSPWLRNPVVKQGSTVGPAICGRLSPARGGSIRLPCYRESGEFGPAVLPDVSTHRYCPWSLRNAASRLCGLSDAS